MIPGRAGQGIAGVDGNTALTFVNNIYPACTSTAYRTALSPQPPASQPPTFSAPAALLGTYQSDGTCVPSPQCCCADGLTRVARSGGGGSELVVSTVLDGVLLSCFNQDGAVALNFSMVDASHASGVYQSVAFNAVWSSDGSILISNSLHPSCPTRLVAAGTSNGAAGVMMWSGDVVARAMWYAVLLVVSWSGLAV